MVFFSCFLYLLNCQTTQLHNRMTKIYWNNRVWPRTGCVGNTDLKLYNVGKPADLNGKCPSLFYSVSCVDGCNFTLGIAYLSDVWTCFTSN